MANEFLSAADDVRRLLRGFAGAQAAADAFEKVGSLQQAGDEAAARLAKLQPQIAAAQAELAALRAEKDVVHADQRASELLADAQARAAAATAQAQSEVEQARAQRDALVAEVADLERRVAAIKANAAQSLGLSVG